RLPNGVDRRRFRPPLAPPRARPPRLLFLGRLDEQKRPDLLLEAFAGLVGAPDAADALPPELELHFAGEGPWRARLEASARALGLEGRVRFLGLCADAPGLLRSGPLALALPSVAEGMPNAVLEALACGVPVVASDLPGTREAAGDAALLVPPGDLPALRAALARVLADDGLRARLAAAGPERARSFDLDALAARHLALFHELAGSAPRIAPPLRPSALLPPAGAGLRVLGGAARSLRAALGGRLTRSFGGGDTRDEPARAAPPSPDPKEDP
ncbi:MAG: glycosyltransferase, partial [Planctomycetota bacterium]